MSAQPAPARAPGVLFIVSSLATGGAEKHVVTLLNHLDTSRFRLHLAYLKRDEKLLPALRQERLGALMCCDAVRRVDGEAIGRLRELIAAAEIDALVCTNGYATLYGQLARRGLEAPPRIMSVFHTTVPHGLKDRAQMLLYRRLFNRLDLMVYVCEGQRAYWRRRGVRPPADQVIYNGIDVDYFTERRSGVERSAFRASLGFNNSDYLIGLCSALRPEKAHVDLLEAVARLRSSGIAAKALLIGDGPQRGSIERAIRRLALQSHVRITGLTQDVRAFIGACDVMTLVSRSVETFSLAALESMCMAKPMVMSLTGGAAELLTPGEHGFLFEPGDIDALTRHLTALASPTLRRRMADAAARRVREHFTLRSMTDRFTDCIEGLVQSGAARADPLSR
jgi:glycosyltransferase involved in cell wall biosynthesis